MSKLNEKRLNQMIENALSYKQEVKTLNQNSFFRRLKVFIFKPKVYGFTFASNCYFLRFYSSNFNIKKFC